MFARWSLPFFLALSLLLAASPAHALEDILSITTTTTTGTPSVSEGFTFNNDQHAVDTITSATDTYQAVSAADNVFVRRNGVNNNQSSIWYATSGVGTDLSGIHHDNYAQMLGGNNFLVGSDNIFANGTDPITGNIERVDFTWNSPITVSNSFAFAVFDRGAVNIHDAFTIAVVTAVDGAGNPTAYGGFLVVTGGWGANNAVADFTYRFFRYNNGDITTTTTDSTATFTQGLGGIIIKASDLGLAPGTDIYGYSLMASDVTVTDPSQLLDWTDATYFPTNTDSTTGVNGLDLVGVNGLLFAVVPETAPSALLLGAFGFFAVLCNHLRKRRESTR
jgi:hypothetical protein